MKSEPYPLEHSLAMQYEDGMSHYGAMDGGPMYDPHGPHRAPMQSLGGHGPHMNHTPLHQYHGNHVSGVMGNHIMGSVPDVHKRDKDAIYG